MLKCYNFESMLPRSQLYLEIYIIVSHSSKIQIGRHRDLWKNLMTNLTCGTKTSDDIFSRLTQ